LPGSDDGTASWRPRLPDASPSPNIAEVSDTVPSMGLFRRAPTNDAAIEELRAEMASLRDALEQQGSSASTSEGQLRALEPQPPPAEPTPVEPDPRVDALAELVAALEARVTAVSTELVNQLTELGHDIDALAARPSGNGDAAAEAALGEIRDGQVRLANEQARYQMAFREDLARLADELKRPR
jgi:hypothetical protein